MFPRSPYLPKVLRNILLCSFYRLTGKLNYPSRILPKTFFKNLIDIDFLFGSQRVYFLRSSDKPQDLTFNNLGDTFTLKEDNINYSEIPNLSVNLIGGRFKIRHAKFKLDINSEACKHWDGKSSVFLSEHLNNYSVSSTFCPVFIDPKYIHDLNIPYDRPQDKHVDNLLKALEIDIKPDNKKYHFKGRLKFVSVPTNLNYWHVELRIYDFNNEPINYRSSNWTKELCRQILSDVICVNAFPLVPSFVSIPNKYFKK